jgi:hypothetical protein
MLPDRGGVQIDQRPQGGNRSRRGAKQQGLHTTLSVQGRCFGQGDRGVRASGREHVTGVLSRAAHQLGRFVLHRPQSRRRHHRRDRAGLVEEAARLRLVAGDCRRNGILAERSPAFARRSRRVGTRRRESGRATRAPVRLSRSGRVRHRHHRGRSDEGQHEDGHAPERAERMHLRTYRASGQAVRSSSNIADASRSSISGGDSADTSPAAAPCANAHCGPETRQRTTEEHRTPRKRAKTQFGGEA